MNPANLRRLSPVLILSYIFAVVPATFGFQNSQRQIFKPSMLQGNANKASCNQQSSQGRFRPSSSPITKTRFNPGGSSASRRQQNSDYIDQLYQTARRQKGLPTRSANRQQQNPGVNLVSHQQNINGRDPYHGHQANIPTRTLMGKDGKPIQLPVACTTGIPEKFFQNGGRGPREQDQRRFASDQQYPRGSRNPRGRDLDRYESLNYQQREGYRENLRQLVRGEDLYGKQDFRHYEANSQGRHNQTQTGNQRYPNRQVNFNAATYNPHAKASAKNAKGKKKKSGDYLNQPGPDPHADVFATDLFPSAVKCAKCHQQIFDEWASSSHAYSAISPMFNRFEDTINRLAQGTVGYFCMRCHAPVGTTLGLRRDQPIWDAPRVVREGVTCVVCHHVKEITLKMNGERRVEPGTINAPVAGNSDGMGVEAALANANSLKVKVDPNDKRPGQLIHKRAYKFEELSKSTFCIACHQVAVQPGIKLEVVAEQYRASPARRQGITCQDCHMGKVPGAAEGYSVGPAAVVDGKVVNPLRRHSNHMFFGPGYSIAHPGIFPHDPAQDRWTFNQWLEFDWRAGWGTEKFENDLADRKIFASFPPIWSDPDDRYDAREIVDRNLKKLAYKKQVRRQVMENGSNIDGPYFTKPRRAGEALEFNYCVSNKSPGHNMPSGSLGAQPQLWLNVVLIDPDGCRIWETGYLDSNGDLCDLHSLDVLARKIPLDKQLCNYQTKFLTTNVKGTDRENYLPVNFDFDQLPFIRPAAQPVTVINHPPFIRMEGHSIPALGSRKAKFRIPGRLIKKRGTYRLSVRLRSRAEPIYFMKFVKSTPEMIKTMNEWIVDVHPYSTSFEVR